MKLERNGSQVQPNGDRAMKRLKHRACLKKISASVQKRKIWNHWAIRGYVEVMKVLETQWTNLAILL